MKLWLHPRRYLFWLHQKVKVRPHCPRSVSRAIWALSNRVEETRVGLEKKHGQRVVCASVFKNLPPNRLYITTAFAFYKQG